MIATRALHFKIHDIWVVIGILSAFIIPILLYYNKYTVNLVWIFIALLIIYIVFLNVIIAPFPRYGIPYKVLLIPLSIYGIRQSIRFIGAKWIKI